ncbi:MAG: hypothetical protein AAFY76_18660, partial [Cyanobacteria bacterium J06649_11]
MNRLNQNTIIVSLLFVILLLGMGITQMNLKEAPQQVLIGFGAILLFLKILQERRVSTIMLYLLMSIMTYVSISILAGYLTSVLHPDAGWIEVNGERRRVMNMNWIFGSVLGLILSPVLVWKYSKTVIRNSVLELSFVTVFVVLSTLIYFRY